VAAAARAVELAARNSIPADLSYPIGQLAAAVDAVRKAVAVLARGSDQTPAARP
jgi:hypothetical protein